MLTANLRSFSLIGLQIGSPSRLTSTAFFLLKNTTGGSAFTPSTFLGMIWLRSMLASTRSRPITRSSTGIVLSISVTISRTCSLPSVGKLDSVIFMSLKLTSRASVAIAVSASSLMLPSAGFAPALASFASYATAA